MCDCLLPATRLRRALAAPAAILVQVLQAGLLGQRDSLSPFRVVLMSCAASLLGDLVFIGRLGLGLAGAAWTTVLSQVQAPGQDMPWRTCRATAAALLLKPPVGRRGPGAHTFSRSAALPGAVLGRGAAPTEHPAQPRASGARAARAAGADRPGRHLWPAFCLLLLQECLLPHAPGALAAGSESYHGRQTSTGLWRAHAFEIQALC